MVLMSGVIVRVTFIRLTMPLDMLPEKYNSAKVEMRKKRKYNTVHLLRSTS
jgi:hypothetical protein